MSWPSIISCRLPLHPKTQGPFGFNINVQTVLLHAESCCVFCPWPPLPRLRLLNGCVRMFYRLKKKKEKISQEAVGPLTSPPNRKSITHPTHPYRTTRKATHRRPLGRISQLIFSTMERQEHKGTPSDASLERSRRDIPELTISVECGITPLCFWGKSAVKILPRRGGGVLVSSVIYKYAINR